jgi:XTP/dITP diphosphohydrolase
MKHWQPTEASEQFIRLLTIMDELREQCPWDRKQTFDTVRHLTIEETFELSDSIIDRDWRGIRGELGDLLLHIVFYARMAAEEDRFEITELITVLCEKLIRRHPHIYGNAQADSAEAVLQNWESIKLAEKEARQAPRAVLGGVPRSLPALIKAYRMQEKAASVGFDWQKPEPVLEKVHEELAELETARLNQDPPHRIAEEMGDVLFSIVNYCRHIGVNPDDALEKANRKFKTRFEAMEQLIATDGRQIETLGLETLDTYWQRVKALPKMPPES